MKILSLCVWLVVYGLFVHWASKPTQAASAKPVTFYWSQPFPCGSPQRVSLSPSVTVWVCLDERR